MSVLEQLWIECKKREVCEKNNEIKKLKSNMTNSEGVLRESLTESSENLFDEYDAYRTEYEEHLEQKAFEQGISVAVRFILESLG